MTTAKDLSGTWSVAAFHRAIAHIERLADDEHFVPTLTRCGALPEGWPEAPARRLALAMIWATPGDPDAFVTDAQGRIVFRGADMDAWRRELVSKEGYVPVPGALRAFFEELIERSLLELGLRPTHADRRGPEPVGAFVTRLRQKGAELRALVATFRRGWRAGADDDLVLLAQALKDGVAARAVEAWWLVAPHGPDGAAS